MFRSLVLLLLLPALSAPPAAAQEVWEPAGGWARWLGLEPGDSIVYTTPDGGRTCALVGEPIGMPGSQWLPIDNLPWPGFASDSRVLLPLDGFPAIGAILTPGPRPRIDALLPRAAELLRGVPPAERRRGIDHPAGPEPEKPPWGGQRDGWYIVGDSKDPDRLVFIRCSVCMDAGLRLVLERGRGIVSLTTTTIVGTESFRRVEGGCAEKPAEGTEFEVYVIPGDSSP